MIFGLTCWQSLGNSAGPGMGAASEGIDQASVGLRTCGSTGSARPAWWSPAPHTVVQLPLAPSAALVAMLDAGVLTSLRAR
jgi:hypothetical protein